MEHLYNRVLLNEIQSWMEETTLQPITDIKLEFGCLPFKLSISQMKHWNENQPKPIATLILLFLASKWHITHCTQVSNDTSILSYERFSRSH